MQIDVLEQTLDRARRRRAPSEIHLHDPDVPESGWRNDVARPPSPPGRSRARARAARARGQPLWPAALRGRGAADVALARDPGRLARRRRLRHLHGHDVEDPLAGAPRRLGRRAASGAGEAQPRQTVRRPLLVVADAVLRRRGTSPVATGAIRCDAARRFTAPAATRCSTRSPSTCRHRRAGRSRGGACSSGSRCPTTSTRPTCSRGRCARTSRSYPARRPMTTGAATSSMRLNFSSSTEDEIREGVRRIGQDHQRAGRSLRASDGRRGGRRRRHAG